MTRCYQRHAVLHFIRNSPSWPAASTGFWDWRSCDFWGHHTYLFLESAEEPCHASQDRTARWRSGLWDGEGIGESGQRRCGGRRPRLDEGAGYAGPAQTKVRGTETPPTRIGQPSTHPVIHPSIHPIPRPDHTVAQ